MWRWNLSKIYKKVLGLSVLIQCISFSCSSGLEPGAAPGGNSIDNPNNDLPDASSFGDRPDIHRDDDGQNPHSTPATTPAPAPNRDLKSDGVPSGCAGRVLEGPIVSSPFSDGAIPISTANELMAIRSSSQSMSGNYRMTASIDLAGLSWPKIGSYGSFWTQDCFSGTLDGNGFEIKNLNVQDSNRSELGLFGCLNGTVKNLMLRDFNLLGGSRVGAVAGFGFGRIENVHLVGNSRIKGMEQVGGLAGTLQGGYAKILRSSSEGIVEATNSHAGGLLGGTLFGPWDYIGPEILESFSKAQVRAGNSAGGLLGNLFMAYIKRSCSDADVEADGVAGGLVGTTFGFNPGNGALPKILESRAKGSVRAKQVAGGLVGELQHNLMIQNVYAQNRVEVTESIGGGFIGRWTTNQGAYFESHIETAYVSGVVQGVGTKKGRLFGVIYCDNCSTARQLAQNVVAISDSMPLAGEASASLNSFDVLEVNEWGLKSAGTYPRFLPPIWSVNIDALPKLNGLV